MRTSLLFTLPLLAVLGCPTDPGDSGDTADTADTGDTGDTDTDTDTDTGNADFSCGDQATACVDYNGACALSGTYTEDLCLTADKPWLLRGGVTIGDDATTTTLSIEPGTQIYGESAQTSFLAIARHSRIQAEGTADAPIVFTSDKLDGSRGRGDWGGVAINGLARINGCADGVDPCEAEAEGGVGKYGGNNDADNSGVLKYVRIEFGGIEISEDNEINGLGLAGVGSGTVVDHVQIHAQNDDCIEFWGGTVSVKHIVCSLPGDDALDWDFGWTGKLQFMAVIQDGNAGNNGIEADNNEDDHAAAPMSSPTISNVTLWGDSSIADSNYGIMLRRGTGGHLSNLAVGGFAKACLAIRDQQTYDNFGAGDASLEHVVLGCASDYETGDDGKESMQEEAVFEAEASNVKGADLMLTSTSVTAPSWLPKSGSPLLGAGASPADAWFDSADYVGAFGTDDWTAGWTAYPAN